MCWRSWRDANVDVQLGELALKPRTLAIRLSVCCEGLQMPGGERVERGIPAIVTRLPASARWQRACMQGFGQT